jgi:hypothetical protein
MQKKIAFIMTLATFNLVANSGEAAESCEQKVVRLEQEISELEKMAQENLGGWGNCISALKQCRPMNNLPRNNSMNDMLLRDDNDMLLRENNDILRHIKRELE